MSNDPLHDVSAPRPASGASHPSPDEGTSRVVLGGRAVGEGQPAFILAEVGVNHDGQVDQALRLIDVAAAAGVDAVKFQVFEADALAAREAPQAAYQQASDESGSGSQHAMLRALELSDAEFAVLAARCRERGVHFVATPFSESDVARVVSLGGPAIKVASTDLTNQPLLQRIAATGLPVIISTGASEQSEIEALLQFLARVDVLPRTVLLHCVSSYPTALEDANLRRIASLRALSGLPVGFSDHTQETLTGALAVAAGACVIEKHITLDRRLPGPDHRFSLEPAALQAYVAQIRQAERALGSRRLAVHPSEQDVRRVARKSVVVRVDLEAGHTLEVDELAVKRPGTGIPPAAIQSVIGRQLRRDVSADEVLQWEDLA